MPERCKRFITVLRPTLGIWFFAGMPLSMFLTSLYSFFGVSPPALLFLLTSITYFSGSLLGGLWSRENLWKRSHVAIFGPLCILIGSFIFFCLGIIFAVVACKRL